MPHQSNIPEASKIYGHFPTIVGPDGVHLEEVCMHIMLPCEKKQIMALFTW